MTGPNFQMPPEDTFCIAWPGPNFFGYSFLHDAIDCSFSCFYRAGWLDIAMRFLVSMTTSVGHHFLNIILCGWRIGWTDGRTKSRLLPFISYVCYFHCEELGFWSFLFISCLLGKFSLISLREGMALPPTRTLLKGGNGQRRDQHDGILIFIIRTGIVAGTICNQGGILRTRGGKRAIYPPT